MGFLDKFKKKPEWEKEIHSFIKGQSSSQPDMDNSFIDNACYFNFVKGNNNKLYSIVVSVSDKEKADTANVFVCKYKFDDITKLKEVAVEIAENQKRVEQGLAADGYTSSEQIIIEIGETTCDISNGKLKHLLDDIIKGSAYLQNNTFNIIESVQVLSSDIYVTARELLGIAHGDSIQIEDYHGFYICAENNIKTNPNKLNLIIRQGDFPIGSCFTDKSNVLNMLGKLDDGSLIISRSTTYWKLDYPAGISQISAFDRNQRMAWKIQDGLEKGIETEFKIQNCNLIINADKDGYEMKINFSDNDDIAADFRGLELYYDLSDKFDFTELVRKFRNLENETFKISAMTIIEKAGEINSKNENAMINRRMVGNALDTLKISPLDDITIHEACVVLGRIYRIKPYIEEFEKLANEMRKNESKIREN